ncbi:PHP domain-containing protein [Halorussus salilacus]|uniref:PHP domain-containing protein n=1 Tax=Halorussus salilacus TaxID=2953750 RepID=UPI00209E3022|nr:PHP domain-containing protein [Halorussus salilacus]USZ67873.1 PHP domain-containing protein [Halorussus salilacus]
MPVTHDYHVHSNYSDGSVMPGMVRAAADAGLEAVGFADHCNVADRERMRRAKREYGFNLDRTYPLRREAIETLRERFDLTVYDAVELDYDPRDEAAIADFLDEADFDYALGSVHHVDGENVQSSAEFADRSPVERRAIVERYYESLVSLAESELFEIAAHVDLVERTPELRGYTTADHREMVADAFARSPTVPEVNAGRALGDYGEFHPASDLFDALRERGVEFVVGSDSHAPAELRERVPALAERFEAADAEPVRLFEG